MSLSNEPGLLIPDSIAASVPNAADSGQLLCAHCETELATREVDQPWGPEDLCASCYDQAGDAYAGREPDYGAVGITEFCARALADKRGR